MATNLFEQQEAPEPMAALTHTVISPENIALDARINRAEPLYRLGLLKARLHCWWLEKTLKWAGRPALEAECQTLESELKILRDYKFDLQAQIDQSPEERHLTVMWDELKEETQPKLERYHELQLLLTRTNPQAGVYFKLKQRIAENPRVLQRAAEELDKMNKQRDESRNYEDIIIDRWTNMGHCYRYTDARGNKCVDRVSFSERHITPEAIYLKIAITERGWPAGMRTLLPRTVTTTALVLPETLEELSLACQRQVSARVNYIRGTWIIINRLETTDGLLDEVRYSDVMVSYPKKFHNRVPICAGVAERKKVKWLNLTDYPHGLIAGFTGSGKSNFVNSIICTLITRHSPQEMRLILVDLKEGVEFATYAGVPHLYGPIIESVPDLADKLEEVLAIMLQRYQKIKGRALSLNQWNAKYPDDHMARIVVVVDEVVSTMDSGDYTKRIAAALKQLVAKGRAAGVHIILSTQRPSVDAIQGLIKINLNFRIVGRMPSHADSLTVLGTGAAKDLPNVPGRMVMQLGPDPIPVQTPMIDATDIEEALKVAMAYEKPETIPVPANAHQTTEWTPERIVALSLQHLGGNIAHTAIWEEIKEDGSLSRAQMRALVERIWKMDCIDYEGKQYRMVAGKGKIKRLVEIEREIDLNSQSADLEPVTSIVDQAADQAAN